MSDPREWHVITGRTGRNGAGMTIRLHDSGWTASAYIGREARAAIGDPKRISIRVSPDQKKLAIFPAEPNEFGTYSLKSNGLIGGVKIMRALNLTGRENVLIPLVLDDGALIGNVEEARDGQA